MIWDLPTLQHRFSLSLTFLQLYWPPSLYPKCTKLNWVIWTFYFLLQSLSLILSLSPSVSLSRSLSPHLISATTPIQKSSDLTSNISETPSVDTLSKVRPQCFSRCPLLFGFFTALTEIWNFAWLFVSLLAIGNKLYCIILITLNNKTKTPRLCISL